MAQVKGEMKEPVKIQEQIHSILKIHPELEKHVVRTPFGTILKPSWAKAAAKLSGTEIQSGKNINESRRKAKIGNAAPTRVQTHNKANKEAESWSTVSEVHFSDSKPKETLGDIIGDMKSSTDDFFSFANDFVKKQKGKKK